MRQQQTSFILLSPDDVKIIYFVACRMISENIKFNYVRPDRNDRRRPRQVKLFFPVGSGLSFPYLHVTRLVKINSVHLNSPNPGTVPRVVRPLDTLAFD